MKPSRYKKEDLAKKAMRKILELNPNGINSEEFVTQVRQKISVSRGKVFDLIKLFEKTHRMIIERDLKDRRKAIYKPVMDRLKTDRGVYQATEFIEELKDPVYDEESGVVDGNKVTIAYFMGFDLRKENEKERESIASAIKKALKPTLAQALQAQSTWGLLVESMLVTNFKLAVVQTIEK